MNNIPIIEQVVLGSIVDATVYLTVSEGISEKFWVYKDIEGDAFMSSIYGPGDEGYTLEKHRDVHINHYKTKFSTSELMEMYVYHVAEKVEHVELFLTYMFSLQHSKHFAVMSKIILDDVSAPWYSISELIDKLDEIQKKGSENVVEFLSNSLEVAEKYFLIEGEILDSLCEYYDVNMSNMGKKAVMTRLVDEVSYNMYNILQGY